MDLYLHLNMYMLKQAPTTFDTGKVSTSEVTSGVIDALETTLKHAGLSPEPDSHAAFAIRLALEEALVNAKKWGNRYDAAKSVRLSARAEKIPRQLLYTGKSEEERFPPDSELEKLLQQVRMQALGGGGDLTADQFTVTMDGVIDERQVRSVQQMEELIQEVVKRSGNRKPLDVPQWKDVDACLSIAVEDEGDGLDPRTVRESREGEALEDTHGRGLLLMRNFMDAVGVDAQPGGGTTVYLTIYYLRERVAETVAAAPVGPSEAVAKPDGE